MTKSLLTINAREWMGDIFIHKLEPMAELVLIRLMMIAEQAGGWLCAGVMPLSLSEIAACTRVNETDLVVYLDTLKALDFVAFDEEKKAYYLPERVAKEALSLKRSAAAKKGGGNPALQLEKQHQDDLFKQNVVSFDKSKTCQGQISERLKKEKRTKKEKNNIYIYTPQKSEKPVVPAYFELGCIRLNKQDYQRWVQEFPYLDLDSELASRSAWLDTRSPDEQSRWFISTRHHLRNRNQFAQNRYDAVNGVGA